MSKIESRLKTSEVGPEDEEAAIEVLMRWAEEHADGLVTRLPHDPNQYPHQKLEVVHIPANFSPENLAMAANLAKAAMNDLNYTGLVSGYQRGLALPTIRKRLAAGQNTLVVTGHVNDTLDTALSHNTLMAAVEPSEQESFANRNVVLANHIMKYMAIAGIPVTEILSWSGDVILGMPASGALRRGMPRNVVRADIQRIEPIYDAMLAKGVVLHQALTGTRAKDAVLPDGRKAKYLPTLDERIFKPIIQRFGCAIAVPMIVEIGNTRGGVYDPRNLYTPDDIVYFMGKLAEELQDYSSVPIFYGKPEGAQEANV